MSEYKKPELTPEWTRGEFKRLGIIDMPAAEAAEILNAEVELAHEQAEACREYARIGGEVVNMLCILAAEPGGASAAVAVERMAATGGI